MHAFLSYTLFMTYSYRATLASANTEHLILWEELRGKEAITVNTLIRLQCSVSLRVAEQRWEDYFWSLSLQKPLYSAQFAVFLLALNYSHQGWSCRDSWSEEFAFLPCVASCCTADSRVSWINRYCNVQNEWKKWGASTSIWNSCNIPDLKRIFNLSLQTYCNYFFVCFCFQFSIY